MPCAVAPRLARLLRGRALGGLVTLVATAAALEASGCTPAIGSSCELSTDCSTQGDRVCDTSEPNGYCTVQNCHPNVCPDEAACVLFNASISGCMYSDRDPSRLGRSFCLEVCTSNSDCRDGYVCADPRQTPWQALILDDDQERKTCIPTPDPGVVIGSDAGTETFGDPVCQVVSPLLEDGGTDAAVPLDAGLDGGDSGDATVTDGGPAFADAGG